MIWWEIFDKPLTKEKSYLKKYYISHFDNRLIIWFLINEAIEYLLINLIKAKIWFNFSKIYVSIKSRSNCIDVTRIYNKKEAFFFVSIKRGEKASASIIKWKFLSVYFLLTYTSIFACSRSLGLLKLCCIS